MGLPCIEILKTFRYGFSMDLATATYISFVPVFVLLFSPFVRTQILYPIVLVYTMVLLILFSFLGILDVGLYADWGTRLSTQILPSLQNPGGMLACVTTWQLILLILVEIAVVLGFIFLYLFLFKPFTKQKKTKWWSIFFVLTYGALLIIPMRGGLQLTPINLSRVYFSSHLFANHAATNPYWSFFGRLIFSSSSVREINFFDTTTYEEIVNNSLQPSKNIPIFIKTKNGEPVNVILIVLESFSNKVIEPLGGAAGITPNFNKLATEGILFNNFYACGHRSDKGMAGLLASYPALVGPYSILHFVEKMDNLDYLANYFNKKDYTTHFYYAGEVDFYNMKCLVRQSNFGRIVSVYDFPSSAKQQNWGVPDELFYERIAADLENFSSPFFLVTYNISSHPPYDIPNIAERNYAQAVTYCDKWLGYFVNLLIKSNLWDNTLVIITSDHGTLDFVSTSYSNPLSHKIPMLWTGGVIDTSFIHSKIGMQTDLSVTLVEQLGWKSNPNPFSKNLFGKNEYAFYFNYNGYGFVSPELSYHYDMDLDTIDFYYYQSKCVKDSLLNFSKAFVQYVYADFRKLGQP